MWEYIDKIMTHPDYDKSFNKVINSALLFGLPELYKRLFDTVEIDGDTNYFLCAGQDTVTGTKVYYQINAAEDPRVAFLQVGDGVMLAYDRSQEPVELLDRDKKPVVRIFKAELAFYYGGAAPAEPQDQPVEDFSAETPVA